MSKLTRIQRVTLLLVAGALIWEAVARLWMRTLPPHDPVIRADLLIIVPLLVVFVGISVVQLLRRPKE